MYEIKGYDDWKLKGPDEVDEVEIYDIYGDEIYWDEYAFDTLEGWVHEDNATKWIVEQSEPIEEGTVTYFDGETAWAGDYYTYLFDEEYYSEDTAIEFLEHLGFEKVRGEYIYDRIG